MHADLCLWIWTSVIALIAAIQDSHTRRISDNLLCVGIIGLGLGLYFTQESTVLWDHVWSGLLGLWIASALFHFKILGGGDAKLLTVASLLVPLGSWVELWLWIFLAGGFQALWAKIISHEKNIPYAVAIFSGVFAFGIVRILNF